MKKMLGLMLIMVSFVLAGPVTYYGKLIAKNGALYSANTNDKVQLKGMSFFWDSWSEGYDFYKSNVVDSLVSKWHVEIVRVAHGTGGNLNSSWESLDNAVIQAAIDNDIYVIIDFHSHSANNEVDEAKTFFTKMASKWGKYPNVIFEVFNEPTGENMWSTVKEYANTIIPVIRQNGGTDNLIIVGNSQYSSHPEEVGENDINDGNVAYTFHFYANEHTTTAGQYNGYKSYQERVSTAIQNGLTVFVTEWGTTDANGDGTVSKSESNNWMKYLDSKKISWCNWSVSYKGENTAVFKNQQSYTNPSNWQESGYSESGKYVDSLLQANYATAPWKGASSSSSSISSVSSSSVSSTTTSVIDDFEDGNGIANTGLEDYWYAFTDVNDKGGSSIENTSDEEGYVVVIPDAAKNSDYGAGMTGIKLVKGENEYAPYVALGLDVHEGLVGCKTITYDYKGAAHNFKVVMDGDEVDKSPLTDYNRHKTALVESDSWKQATVEAVDLKQEEWGEKHPDLDMNKVVQLQWEVKGNDAGTQQLTYDYLYIDNFACDGMSIVPVVVPDEESSASETTSSETVEVSSSSFENPTCEDGETASAGTLTMLCVEGEWTVVAASSSSATPAAGSAMIDDVEDGDGQAFTGGFWFAYTDVNDKGSSIITNSPDDDGGYVVVLPGTNGTENMVGLTGISLVQGSNENEPYVSLGLNITEEDAANDFTSCTEISYDYMGAAHNFKAIMKGDAKGELTGYNRHASTQSSSTTWTTATLSWSDLKQASGWGTTVSLDKSLLTAFHWEVKGDKNGTQPSPNYLYIDNLQCKGMNIVPVTSSSSEEVVESSSSEEITTSECEDGQEIHVGSAALKCVEGKWTDISVGSSSSAGGSSSSEGGSSASTGAPGVIDDMEDGDNQAFSGGYWFVYNDANDKGQSSFGNALDGKDYVVVFDGTNGSDYMVGMKDVSLVQGGNENEPYVAMGVNITDEKKANNLASCTEISYDYIGAAHNFKAIMAGDETGGLTGYNRHSKAVSASTTWTKATIDWSALSQATGWGKTLTLDKTKITAFHWEIKGDKNGTQPSPNYLYVDNFTCTGLDVAALASSSSSSQPTSSSSYNPYTPTSSSSYNPYLPTSSSSYDPWAIGAVQARGGLKVSMSGSTLNVTVERAGLVKVNVFDMMGHAIESHVENLSAGTYGHSLANLSKGAYIVRVQQGSEQKVIRTQVR